MRRIKRAAIILIPVFLSACQLLLGPDPDTSPEGVLYSLWKNVNELHAYVHIRMDMNANFADWEEVYQHYKDELLSDKLDLFSACAGMLDELKDPHIALYAPGGNIYMLNEKNYTYKTSTSFYSEKEEFIGIVSDYLTDGGIWSENEMFLYGTFINAPHIGYLYISKFIDSANLSWAFDWAEEIDRIINFFRENAAALIIDIRYNTGGISQVQEYIAARFAAVQEDYILSSAKNGPGRNDFSEPMIYRITPTKITYTRPTILLTNKASISMSEWFTLAMRKQPHVTHAGLSTQGALSVRTIRPMINGWYYSTSSQKITDMDGKCYEGFGVRPQVEIIGEEVTRWAVHPGKQLEAVLEWLDSRNREDTD